MIPHLIRIWPSMVRNWKYLSIFLGLLIGGTVVSSIVKTTWGLRGEYYSNLSWEGFPAVSRIDKLPYLRGTMGRNLLSTNTFSVKWSGWILIDVSGTYQFATNSDDGSFLWIDGKMILDNGGPHGLQKKSAELTLKKGVYPIEVLYFQAGGFSVIETLWTPPKQGEEQIPAKYLFARSPGRSGVLLRKWGNYVTQCIIVTWEVFAVCLAGLGVGYIFHVYQIRLTWRSLWVGIFCGITFWVTYFSPVDYTGFDPLGNLLTAQTILRQGTLRLDSYAKTLPAIGYQNGWHLYQKNGHLYYYFPLGTPLFSIPSVWVANWLDADMVNRMDDTALQNLLSAVTTTLAALLIYFICRQYLRYTYSLLFSTAFVFGSSITSTMGTGLHSINYTVVFELLSLLIVISDREQKPSQINPYLLGILLFSAYLCRPSAAIFVGLILLYILLKGRMLFIQLAFTCLLLLGVFMLFSWKEYRSILPDYYLPTRLNITTISWSAFYANLFSPSRGVFVFSPYLLLSLLGVIMFFKRLLRFPLFWLSLSWALLQLFTIAKFHHWWGGGSYGNRLFADTFPSLIVLTLLVWREAFTAISPVARRIALSFFVLVTLGSIFINTYQGLYNTYTVDWGDNIEDLVNWRYPQFLASHQLLAERDIANQAKMLLPYKIGERIEPNKSCRNFL